MALTCNKKEAMRYLGYRGQELSNEILKMIDEIAGEAEKAATPRHCTVSDELCRDGGELFLKSSGMALEGQSIKNHLKNCDKVILLAATLGIETDRLIRMYEARDMTRAVIFDACASALIETCCDGICTSLEREAGKEGLYPTKRFSPGYGDMPLSAQPGLIRVLDAQRKIGLTLSDSLIMLPRKSVTAIIGLSRERQSCGGYGCDMCSMNKTCPNRK